LGEWNLVAENISAKLEYWTLCYIALSHTSEKYFKILTLIIYIQWSFPQP
jgi:hypothetical protein